jgi:hypothetical protein
MHDLIAKLYEIGFTPLNIVMAVAVIVVWRRSVGQDRKQTTDRETWHAETRAQLDEVKKHTKECEEDRIKLKAQMDIISSACHRKDCPRRLP